MEKEKSRETELFETMPIKRAVLALIGPTVLSQLIMLIYNMADTWFIGQTGDTFQVAAVTVSYPMFMLLNAIANLFGIGGGSYISRLLGSGEGAKAGQIASFAIWASAGVTLIFSVLLSIFCTPALALLGGYGRTADYAADYLFWTVVIGGVPTVLSVVLGSLLRAQGKAKTASIGIALGGILNVVLDPIFIFVLDMDVAGAALATGLSNVASMLYLLYAVIHSRHGSLLKMRFLPSRLDRHSAMEMLSIGTPAALQVLLSSVSNSVMLRLVGGYAASAISGMGIMQKVEIIPFQIVMGVSTGVLPLVAYNFASGNRERMQAAVRFALTLGFGIALASWIPANT